LRLLEPQLGEAEQHVDGLLDHLAALLDAVGHFALEGVEAVGRVWLRPGGGRGHAGEREGGQGMAKGHGGPPVGAADSITVLDARALQAELAVPRLLAQRRWGIPGTIPCSRLRRSRAAMRTGRRTSCWTGE